MIDLLRHLIVTIVTLIKVSRPGGVKALMAENNALKQQLMVMNHGKTRSPKLTTNDRFLFGLFAFFISEHRLQKVAVILKPATILRFHQALVKRKSLDL